MTMKLYTFIFLALALMSGCQSSCCNGPDEPSPDAAIAEPPCTTTVDMAGAELISGWQFKASALEAHQPDAHAVAGVNLPGPLLQLRVSSMGSWSTLGWYVDVVTDEPVLRVMPVESGITVERYQGPPVAGDVRVELRTGPTFEGFTRATAVELGHECELPLCSVACPGEELTPWPNAENPDYWICRPSYRHCTMDERLF